MTIGRQEEIIAAALRQVADECAEIAWSVALLYAHNKKQPERSAGADSVWSEIRARFPKEEK